jgi:hypothetical protein
MKDWVDDNEFVFSADAIGTELLHHTWTIAGGSATWVSPIVDATAFPPATRASAPSCVDTTLLVTDASNCVRHPLTCSVQSTSCVPVPVRITYDIVSAGIAALELHVDPGFLDLDEATYTWSADGCVLLLATVDTAFVAGVGPACRVTGTVVDGADRDREYGAVMTVEP